MQVLEIEIHRTLDPQVCKSFPVKAGFNYAAVQFKTSFLAYRYWKTWDLGRDLLDMKYMFIFAAQSLVDTFGLGKYLNLLHLERF